MIRRQALKTLHELREKIRKAIENEEYHIDFDSDEFIDDVDDALMFAISDMCSLQDIINITNDIMEK